jgi:acetoin utilization protein AcuB
MLEQIINNAMLSADQTTTVGAALQFMDDDDVKHIAVFNNKVYIGILSKNSLLNYDETQLITVAFEDLMPVFVHINEHFSKALRIMGDKEIDVLPVLSKENEYLGVILAPNLLFKMAQFVGADEKGAIIVLEIDRRHFAFSEITRLVETNDATIMQLNTQLNPTNGLMWVTIKINKQEVSDVLATLQRYDYNVVAYFGEEAFENVLQENYSHLMHYLKI